MPRRFTTAGFLGALLVLGIVSIVQAQGAMSDEPGFQPNRDYLALLPWESIDTGSNNVILTFTDLVLPGNGGRELRFDRVFSNQGPAPPESGGPQWRFGIAGIPMRVVERPAPTAPLPVANIAAERNTTPYFPMLDGSRLETAYTQPPIHDNPSTLIVVRTSNFWIYDRSTRVLRIPDGTFAQFCPEEIPSTCPAGYLIKVWNAFDNNDTHVTTLAVGPEYPGRRAVVRRRAIAGGAHRIGWRTPRIPCIRRKNVDL